MTPMDPAHTKQIRLDVLDMVCAAKEGHIPSAFSVVELLYVIYHHMDPAQDAFFLSKGHASAALYATLAHKGLLPREELATFCKYDSKLGGHPHPKLPHVMSASGSLGHGFPIAAGYAMAKKIRGEAGQVFALIGDGESNEGTIWETAAYAAHLNLSNFVCLVDDNESQTRAVPTTQIAKKFEAFGWDVQEVDGHDMRAIHRAAFLSPRSDKPLCVVARTVKGKGVKAMEANFAWHHKAPTPEEYESFKQEILSA